MNILIATDTYYPNVNGAAYFTYRLAQLLARRGHHISVIAPSQTLRGTISLRDGVTEYGTPSIPIPIYPNFRISPMILCGKSVMRIVREVHPDVVHLQNHFMIGKATLMAAHELNIATIGTNHFMPENLVHYLHLPKVGEEQLNKFAWRKFIHVYGELDIVTTPTKTAAKMLHHVGLQKDVIPISCGIDLKRFNPQNDGAYLKKRYALPDRDTLLYVGRLDKEKHIEVILNAIPRILQKLDVQLVLAGVGKLRSSLERHAEKLNIRNNVTFTGFVPDEDLPNLYRIAALFVIASTAELQSIVTMEAMASSLPVVAVNATALPELVHSGENGYLFESGKSRDLAERVIMILGDKSLRNKMAERSLELIQAHDIEKVVACFETLYFKLQKGYEKNSSKT